MASPSPSFPPSADAPACGPAAPGSPEFAAVVAELRACGCVFAEEEACLLFAAAGVPLPPGVRERHAGGDVAPPPDAPSDPRRGPDLATLLQRRVAGLPLEQVLGWAGFGGLRIGVDPGVFVPRRRTEFLVATAVAVAPARPVVVDLCCGTGAVAAALAAALDVADLHAVDVDPAAVRCARRNLPSGTVHRGDLYAPLPAALRGRVDLLVANVPYVPSGEVALLPQEARVHEPLVALDGGPDGLDVLRRVAAGARHWLAPGGRLLVETGRRQAPAAARAFAHGGLTTRVAESEEYGATVVVGTGPPHRMRDGDG